ncbi:MAG: 30S ribosomal protein S5 [Candidatus Nomurabacteria bacterium]|jgi:small subunit ribosomal protein S5|nr:30S ribosomal protein S5 [Candidatus Nomurabacteria bacterium]
MADVNNEQVAENKANVSTDNIQSEFTVVNEQGTTRAFSKDGERGRGGRGGRDNRGRGRRDEAQAPKEFEEVTVAIDRVARVVKGGRRFRFKALVAVGDGKNRVGVGVAKGQDVTAAVNKATDRAKKNIIKINLEKTTIPHEVMAKETGAVVLMKPAPEGFGIVAGGVVRTILGLTGIKNVSSKSLGSTNKVNIAYATIKGLASLQPKSEWITRKDTK